MTSSPMIYPNEVRILKAFQTLRMTHKLLEMGYRFDDEKASAMMEQLRESVNLLESFVPRRAAKSRRAVIKSTSPETT